MSKLLTDKKNQGFPKLGCSNPWGFGRELQGVHELMKTSNN